MLSTRLTRLADYFKNIYQYFMKNFTNLNVSLNIQSRLYERQGYFYKLSTRKIDSKSRKIDSRHNFFFSLHRDEIYEKTQVFTKILSFDVS